MNAIDSKDLKRGLREKPLSIFRIQPQAAL